jgi:hypothetical protein
MMGILMEEMVVIWIAKWKRATFVLGEDWERETIANA